MSSKIHRTTMSRKRRSSEAQDSTPQTRPPKKVKAEASDESIPGDDEKSKQRCFLLEIPPDLRILIYEKVVDDFPAYLPIHSRGKLICGSTLLGANRQIRDELLGELYLKAPIFATVVDFQFSHIVSFLNRLSTSELKSLPRAFYNHESNTIVRIGRLMRVELVLSSLSRDEQIKLRSQALDRAPNLEKWIRRVGNPDKRILTPDVRYAVRCTNPDRLKNLVTLRSWEAYLEDLRSSQHERPSRQRTEITAIRVAVLEENKAILERILDALQNGQ